MPNKPRDRKSATSKSGVLPRPVLESEGRREPPPPPSTLPEFKEDQGTTGALPAVNEGHDSSAIGDDDRVNASGGLV